MMTTAQNNPNAINSERSQSGCPDDFSLECFVSAEGFAATTDSVFSGVPQAEQKEADDGLTIPHDEQVFVFFSFVVSYYPSVFIRFSFTTVFNSFDTLKIGT